MQREHPAATHQPLIDDCVPAMVWTARPDLSCDYLSRPWLEFTGYSQEQALGDGWSRGVHPEDLARWLDTCVRAFDAREPFEMEYRLRRHDGQYRWVIDRGVPRFSRDGVFLGYAGLCVDIDERRRAQHELARALERERRLRLATEEASRVKDGFVATILDDLRAPVQAIATWARHLRGQAAMESEAGQALAAIEENARAQARIIADLLELARLQGGAAPVRRRELDAPLLGGLRVLVVDQDAGALETVTKVLEIAGAKTRSAATAGEALEIVDQWHPDVLVSDVSLRAGEGYGLIRAVRSLPAERGGCMRAAALTPESDTHDGRRPVAAGYDAQLSKPVEPVALLATIARLAQRLQP